MISPIANNLPQHYNNQNSFRRADSVNETLYCITPIFNPHRYRTIWKLYQEYEQRIISSGAHLVTIEASFGERQEALVEQRAENHTVIHVYTENELWLKENLINLAVQRLPKSAKYIAWIDADIQFVRPDWVGETIQKLQHYHVVQMFSVAYDLGPNFVPYQLNYGFVHDRINGVVDNTKNGNWERGGYCPPCPDKLKVIRHHPGFAWAYTVEAWNALGGMIDTAILGSSDRHMACALFGEYEKSLPLGVTAGYRDIVKLWQERALKYIKKDIGYVEGQINHFFHGSKKFRKYKDRWKIIVKHKFDPYKDLKRMFNGTYQLEDDRIALRDEIRAYFAQRNQDSCDLQPNERPIGL